MQLDCGIRSELLAQRFGDSISVIEEYGYSAIGHSCLKIPEPHCHIHIPHQEAAHLCSDSVCRLYSLYPVERLVSSLVPPRGSETLLATRTFR